jgi:hypothetical protein
MALLDNIIDKGVSLGAAKLADGSWVDSLAKRGASEVLPKLPPGLQVAGKQAIDRIAESKASLGVVSSGTFIKVTSYLGLGMEDEARLTFLRERAGHDERQAALKKATGASYDAGVATRAAWDEMKAVALDVLKMLGQAAIPLLLAAL